MATAYFSAKRRASEAPSPGPTPITTRFTDVWDALDATRRIIEDKAYQDFPPEPARVT